MEAANHLMFSQLFYKSNIKWPTIIFSEANYSTFFSNMPILRVCVCVCVSEREREREREKESEQAEMCVLIICICLSLQTKKLWI